MKLALTGLVSGTGTFVVKLTNQNYRLEIVVLDCGPSGQVSGTIAQKSVASGSSTSGDGSGGTGGGTTTTVKTYTKTWHPNWTQSYDGDGSKRAGGDGGSMYQGYYDGLHGNQKSVASYGDLSGTLSGATIKKITLTFHCTHTYYNAGATCEIGYSSAGGASAPNNWPGKTAIQSKSVVAGNTYTVTLNSSCYNNFQNGSAKAITFGAGATNSRQYYSIYSGYGSGKAPSITVTYSK